MSTVPSSAQCGRVLLIVDLEGVAGVDTLAALVAGTPEYARSQQLLTAEVKAAMEGLLAAGFTQVRISDSHMSGSGATNLLREALPPAAELRFEEDWYSAAVFDGVEAVACLGMHAPAGARGFAAHTVDLLPTWSCEGRLLSEADLVLGLAAEAGLPAIFVSGDDGLQEHLQGRVPYVRTKVAHSLTSATSSTSEEACAALAQAARKPPTPLQPPPAGPVLLTFKSVHQAELAAATGAVRVDPYRVEVQGGSFRERYQRALAAASAASAVLAVARGALGSAEFIEDMGSWLQLPGPLGAPPPSRLEAATHALQGFLRLTAKPDDESRALRALTLHMLEGFAPRLFARWELGPVLEQAVAALAEVSRELPLDLHQDVAMARLDAWYVRRERGLEHPAPEPEALRGYLVHLYKQTEYVHAWLLGELAAACGLDVRLPFNERALRPHWRLADLYWVTHLYLLDTRYLRKPLQHANAAQWAEELLVAVPWMRSKLLVDLAGEVAFCLQLSGEVENGAHEWLLEMLAQQQREDGRLVDERVHEVPEDGAAHATVTALLAFAGAEERRLPRL